MNNNSVIEVESLFYSIKKDSPQLKTFVDGMRDLFMKYRDSEIKINALSKEIEKYSSKGSFCVHCGDLFKHRDLNHKQLCDQCNFELEDRHDDGIIDIEHEELELDRPF